MSQPSARVVFVNRVYWPSTAATAQLLTDLAEGLASRGWAVHVIAAGKGQTEQRGVTIHRTGEGETHGGMVSRALNYRRFLREARQSLTALLQSGDIVIPMTDPPMLGVMVEEVARAKGAKVVQWIQDIYPEIVSAHFGAIASPFLWPLRTQRDAAWRRSAACVTLGSDMAAAITARGVPPAAVKLIPNWAPRELDSRAPAAAIAERRQAWGVADKFVVAYSGNLGRVHEFASILDAAERLRGDARIVFLFIGRGARFDEVQARVAASQLPNVRLLGPEPRENLAAALAAADAHLVSLKPAFGRLVYPSKLAGVLAAGRPVLFVGPKEGEIARFLRESGCGAGVDPTDGAGLASLVRDWKFDAELADRLGRKARHAYENNFTFTRAVESWHQLLQELPAST